MTGTKMLTEEQKLLYSEITGGTLDGRVTEIKLLVKTYVKRPNFFESDVKKHYDAVKDKDFWVLKRTRHGKLLNNADALLIYDCFSFPKSYRYRKIYNLALLEEDYDLAKLAMEAINTTSEIVKPIYEEANAKSYSRVA